MAVFKVDAFRPLAQFKQEVADFARYLKDTPPAEGSQGVFYPGELEAMREADRRANGIEIEDKTIEVLTKLAGELGVAGKLGL